MKSADLRPCDLCGRGLMHTGVPLFYRLSFERMAIDLNAVQERRALTMLFQGGNSSPIQQIAAGRLAEIFAPTAEVAKRLGNEADTLLVCELCSVDFANRPAIAELAERAAHRRIAAAARDEEGHPAAASSSGREGAKCGE